jgi:predicted secreted protein
MNKLISYKILSIFFILIFISCEEILLVDDISEKEVFLTAPVNNAALYSTGVSFSWENVENAEKYQLQIATPNFENPLQIVLDTLVTKNSFTQQLNIGQYEWRIRAVNSGYKTAYKSRSFAIINNEDFQNNTVTLVTPSNNLTTKTAAQKLSWQTIIGATSYQIQILDKDNDIIKEETTSSAFINYTFDEGNHTWKVRASNGTQQTLYSSRSILVDTQAPNTPILSSPVNSNTAAAGDIEFKWSRTSIAGSAEKDSIYVYNGSALTNLNFKDEAVNPYNKTMAAGTYYWFVKSFDAAGNESARSIVFNFTLN